MEHELESQPRLSPLNFNGIRTTPVPALGWKGIGVHPMCVRFLVPADQPIMSMTSSYSRLVVLVLFDAIVSSCAPALAQVVLAV